MYFFDGELSTKDAIARELLAEAGSQAATDRRPEPADEGDGSASFLSAECAVDVEVLTGDAE